MERTGSIVNIAAIKKLKIIKPGVILWELFKYSILIFVAVITLFPLLWVLLSSFKTHTEIFASSLSLPSRISFDGYREALRLAPIQGYYLNSVIVTSCATFLNVFIVSLSAYAVARYDFKLKNAVILIISSSLLLPIQGMAYSIYKLVHDLRLLDTRSGLIIVYSALGLPVTFYIIRSYFLTIPKELEEAAYIDGSSFIRTFAVIMVPIAKPGFATAAILQFLWDWNEFFFALILTSGHKSRTLPLALSYFISRFAYNYTALFAAVIMVITPSIIVFILLQKQVIGGLTAGAIKR